MASSGRDDRVAVRGRRRLIVIAAAGCLLGSLASCGSDDSSDGTAVAGVRSMLFHDGSRDRTIAVDLWYPADPQSEVSEIAFSGIFLAPAARDAPLIDESPRPLVLLSHGSGGGRADQAWLASSLARDGFLVASVEHPGNSFGDDSPEGVVAVWRRPPDISFVLDQLLANGEWGAQIAPNRIGAAGHSSGGYTVIALAGGVYDLAQTEAYCAGPTAGPDCALAESVDFSAIEDLASSGAAYRDERIAAVLAMAPAVGQGFDAAGLAPIEIPVRIVGSVDDELALFQLNAAHYANLIRGAELTRVHPGGHFIYMSPCNELGRGVAAQVCIDPDPDADRRATHRSLAVDAARFFERHLRAERD